MTDKEYRADIVKKLVQKAVDAECEEEAKELEDIQELLEQGYHIVNDVPMKPVDDWLSESYEVQFLS